MQNRTFLRLNASFPIITYCTLSKGRFYHWGGIPNAYGKIAFTDQVIYLTLDPDVIFIEFRGKIEVLKNNKNYNNTYCCRFTFSKGKILN
jgi:hypothetical protein